MMGVASRRFAKRGRGKSEVRLANCGTLNNKEAGAAKMTFVLDIGGEGRHADAWNLNPSRVRTLGPDKGRLIPRLIVGRADAVPLCDQSVDHVLVERAPLTRAAVREIARVVAPGGTVVLRHVLMPQRDSHNFARHIMPGQASERRLWIGGKLIQQTEIHLPGSASRATRGRASESNDGLKHAT